MRAPVQIGKMNTLEVLKLTPQGAYLGDSIEEILLPTKYIPEGLEVGDELEVFIYIDNEDRLICTTLKPTAYCDSFAYMHVKDVTKVGAFLYWGIEKDLLVPFKEQQNKMQVGESYLVYVYLDDLTDRLVASSNINRFLELDEIQLEEGEEVEILIGNEGELGYTAIINETYRGLLYKNEVFKKVSSGDRTKAYVKQIRPDNKIDLELEPSGFGKIEPMGERILQVLKKNDGFLPLHDKSDPEMIKSTLQMSKKNFKKAIGGLYKSRHIEISEQGIKLI